MKEATTEAAQIRAWWRQWPNANIGIATGNGLLVIDIDPRHGGHETIEDLRRDLGAWPDTVEAITGGNGRHIYLSSAAVIKNSAGLLGAGVDIRGEGGYVVAPPSNHVSGRVYAWEASSDPTDGVPLAEIAPAWLDRIASPKRSAAPMEVAAVVGEGGRNNALFTLGRSLRAKGLDAGVILATLTAHNAVACVPPLDDAEVETIARSACSVAPGLSPEYAAKVRRPPEPAAVAAMMDVLQTPTTEEPEADWQDKLHRTAKGAIKNTFANVCCILRGAGEYASLRFNEMTVTPELDGVAVSDARLGRIREDIENRYGFSPANDGLCQALITVASERSYHPVRQYLEALVWDGVPRLNTVGPVYLNAEHTDINEACIRAWFISAVARALTPGCKVDTCMVLVGPQGVGKSSFFRLLGGEWFADTAVDLEGKDAMMQINHAWVYELGELDHVTGRAHAGRIKAFVSSQVDKYRAAYARAVSSHPRCNVIVGSTNEEAFLADPTGDRRFWCVKVPRAIDQIALARDRDQLWAEAVEAHRKQEPWWLNADGEAAQREAAEEFRTVDPWEARVAEWLDAPERAGDGAKALTSIRILTAALAMELSHAGQRESNRLGGIMRRLGYRCHVLKIDGRNARIWQRSDV